jgi:hypothetical protein
MLYFFGNFLENHEYKVEYDPWIGLIFVNLIIFVYSTSLLCIVLYLYFSTFKPWFLKILQCFRCVTTMNLYKIVKFYLGQFNLICRLSSRITKKYGVGGRILFHTFYFPKEKLLMTILFLSTKGVSFNTPNMCSWRFQLEIKFEIQITRSDANISRKRYFFFFTK